MLHDKNFVVYSYVRKNGMPYYIGKGRPNRPYKTGGRPCRTPHKSRIKIIHWDLDEFTALSIESALIYKYGRIGIDSGECYLRNRSVGWDGISGSVWPECSRKKLANTKSIKVRWYHPDYTVSEELSATELVSRFPELKLNQSDLSYVIKGHKLIHKGWMTYYRYTLEKSKREKFLSGKSKDPGKLSRSDHTNKRRTWYHSDYGVFVNKTALELTKLFPEMNLHGSGLYNVASGKYKFYKGWYILQDGENTPKWLNYDKRVEADWVHPIHGEIFNETVEGLVKLFPEEDYKKTHLYIVLNGSKPHYRGWMILPEEGEDPKEAIQRCKPVCIRSKDGAVRFNWFHPQFGEVLNCTGKELREKFPMLKLRTSSFYEVSRGERESYKGWRLLETHYPTPGAVESLVER